MTDSVLDTVKLSVGIDPSCTDFDEELIMCTNTIFVFLHQMGVGPDTVYSITSNQNKWNEFVYDVPERECVKSYVGYKARLMFDPPSNSILSNMLKELISELEFRLTGGKRRDS